MKKNHKLRNRIIAISAATTVFLGTLWGALSLTKDSAYASRVTLKGIDALASAHSVTSADQQPDPYIILEVVPDKNQAMFGYLVGGEEPIYEGKSIKDMPSEDERRIRFKQFEDGVMYNIVPETGAVRALESQAFKYVDEYSEPASTVIGKVTRDLTIRGYFKANPVEGNGMYAANDFKSAYVRYQDFCEEKVKTIWDSTAWNDPEEYKGYASIVEGSLDEDGKIAVKDDDHKPIPYGTRDADHGGVISNIGSPKEIYDDNNVKNIKLSRKTITFRPKDDYFTGSYFISLRRINTSGANPDIMPVYSTSVKYINNNTTSETADFENDAIYNWQYFDAVKLTSLEQIENLHDGQYIFFSSADSAGDKLLYYGMVKGSDVQTHTDPNDDRVDAGTVAATLGLSLLSEPSSQGTETVSEDTENKENENIESAENSEKKEDDDNTENSENAEDDENLTDEESAGSEIKEENTEAADSDKEEKASEGTDETQISVTSDNADEFAEIVFDFSGIGLESFGAVAYMDGGNGLESSLKVTGTPSPTATPTGTPTGEALGTPTPGATGSPVATPTGSPEVTPSGSPEATPSVSPAGENSEETSTQTSEAIPSVSPTAENSGETSTETSEVTPSSNPEETNNSEEPSATPDSTQGNGNTDEAKISDDMLKLVSSAIAAPNTGVLSAVNGSEMYKTYDAVLELKALVSDSRSYDYYVVDFTSNPTSDSYVINGVIYDTEGKSPFGKLIQYSDVYGDTYNSTNAPENKTPYYVQTADQEEYIFKLDPDSTPQDRSDVGHPNHGLYADLKWNYDFRADYTKEPFRKQYKYSGGFENNEWFKQFVLDRDTREEFDNLYVDVIPVTPDEIKDYIDDADLVYFAGGKRLARTKEIEGGTTVADVRDIDPETAMKILDKVVDSNFPVIIERSAYYTNLDLKANKLSSVMDGWTTEQKAFEGMTAEQPNMTLLLLRLMQSNVSKCDSTYWTNTIAEFLAKPVSDVVVREGGVDKGGISGRSVVTTGTTDDTHILRSDISDERAKLINGIYKTNYSDPGQKDVSFVHGTIFVNDDWNDAENEYGDSSWKVVAADFNAQYLPDKLNAINGFTEISAEYDSEKSIIEAYGDWSKFNSNITKATSIRYILNANNNRYAIKSSLRILDLEPLETAQYTNQRDLLSGVFYNNRTYNNMNFDQKNRDILTKDWIKTNIDTDDNVSDNNLSITQMGTREFIGKNDDLNVEYDMIYIGMDTLLMNTEINGNNKSINPRYNDTGMNGLVYSHIGDKLNIAIEQRDSNERDNPIMQNGDVRLSGNDITRDKLRELQEYVQAGYAVLLSDRFFTYDTTKKISGINTEAVDTSSNMYKFIQFVMKRTENNDGYLYLGKNVFRKGALMVDGNTESSARLSRETFVSYLNISKLHINAVSVPPAYNYVNESGKDDTQYIPWDKSANAYILKYEVNLENDSALSASGTTYDCGLYLDLDADGKFEEGEKQTGLMIYDKDGNTVGRDDNNIYHLSAGNTYRIERSTPEEYAGFISWKLEFSQNEKTFLDKTAQGSSNRANIRSAIHGFSAVPLPQGAEKREVKVLQIQLPDPQGRESRTNSLGDEKRNTMDLNQPPFTGAGGLYSRVKEFDVKVHQVSVNQYITKADNEYHASTLSYYDYLKQFDMVVIGFSDKFTFLPDGTGNVNLNYPVWYSANGRRSVNRNNSVKDAVLGIREYILSGRSILFSHDLGNEQQDENGGRAYTNTLLRDVLGMDRFGLYQTVNNSRQYSYDMTVRNGVRTDNADFPLTYQSVYDTPEIKGNNTGDTYGFSDYLIEWRRNNTPTWGITTRRVTMGRRSNGNDLNPYLSDYGNAQGSNTETVTALNEGQITQYPFLITTGTGGTYRKPADATVWNPTFEVAGTHDQWYQLNLDTDSTDENENDDVVVWYTISNSNAESGGKHDSEIHEYYQATHNDARNNYFIYSKGNVMYTGAGHWFVHDEQERMLFVNTLVASYNSGLHAPKVIFKENPWDDSATVYGTHVPYDENLTVDETTDDQIASTAATTGGFLDTTITVNFKTVNNNFRDSGKNLLVDYYVLSETQPAGNFILVDGKYYKQITPNSVKQTNNAGNLENVTDMHSLENYKVYQAEINVADLELGGGVGTLPSEDAAVVIRIGTSMTSFAMGDINLEGTESLNKIDVYTARLHDLE